MTLHTRRAMRITAVMTGVAALGATLSGTAFAAGDDSAFSSADRQSGGYLGADKDTGGYFGDKDGGYFDQSDYQDYFGKDGSKDGVGKGSLSGVGGDMVPFSFPSRGPSTTVPVRNKNDDDGSPIDQYAPSGFGHHDHHGSTGPAYDYDLYSPTESYDKNKCSDAGSSREPIYGSGFVGANGDSSDDCKVDSGDYNKHTGFRGDYNPNSRGSYNGYSGYVGSKHKKLRDEDDSQIGGLF